MGKDISPLNITTMALLDPAGIDSTSLGCAIFSGLDLADILPSRLLQEQVLGKSIQTGLSIPGVQAEVIKLLDEELKSIPDSEDALGAQISPVQKVC